MAFIGGEIRWRILFGNELVALKIVFVGKVSERWVSGLDLAGVGDIFEVAARSRVSGSFVQ